MRLLIVEDQRGLAEGLQAVLKREGFSVDVASDGVSGLDNGLSGIYDLIILDIMLPLMDGFQVLYNLRSEGIATPVLLLTAKSEVEDKVRGLDTGADDYLTKPFDTDEFLARVRALTRRKERIFTPELKYGDITLNTKRMELSCGGQSIRLSSKEFQLLECLMQNSSQIVPKELLWEKVWGQGDHSEYNNVEVYFSFLRKKLKYLHSKVQIKATRTVGYGLVGGEK